MSKIRERKKNEKRNLLKNLSEQTSSLLRALLTSTMLFLDVFFRIGVVDDVGEVTLTAERKGFDMATTIQNDGFLAARETLFTGDVPRFSHG